MKKLFLSLACICGLTLAYAQSDDDRTRRDIQISDAINPIEPDQLRSLLPTVEAWIDFDMNCIEVGFNAGLGTVEATIIDDMTGMAVSSTTVDTNVEPYTLLPIPAEGIYTLRISGNDYLGTGNFTID